MIAGSIARPLHVGCDCSQQTQNRPSDPANHPLEFAALCPKGGRGGGLNNLPNKA
jgi:hypothetical protein